MRTLSTRASAQAAQGQVAAAVEDYRLAQPFWVETLKRQACAAEAAEIQAYLAAHGSSSG